MRADLLPGHDIAVVAFPGRERPVCLGDRQDALRTLLKRAGLLRS